MNANSKKFQSVLESIRHSNTRPRSSTFSKQLKQIRSRGDLNPTKVQQHLSQGELEDYCQFLDSCAGYYHYENEGYYDLEGD